MTEVPEKEEIKNWYYSNFELFENSLNGQSKAPVHKIRKEAIAEFIELGFPTTKNEEWKYTNIAPLLTQNFKPAYLSNKISLSKEEVSKFLFTGVNASILVFVNGDFSNELSSLLPEAKGVKFESLRQVLNNEPDFIEKYLLKSNKTIDGFSALNRAFISDGIVLRVPDSTILENPVHLLFISGSDEENLLVQPLNYIFVGKNSQIKIIESTVGVGSKAYLLNSVTEIFTGENSVTNYYKIQNDPDTCFQVSRTLIHQERSSVFTSNVISIGGELIRNDISTIFESEGCESNLYGLYLADGKRHIDNHTLIDHAVAHCHSNELYKGILDEKARGVFNGKVLVRKDAQKTQAYQSNKNLLLSRLAKVDTKPQLEIFADDVKCSHGATIGQLDEQSMFYLRSRGIGTEKARSLLLNAFASDIVDLISIEPLRETMNRIILDRLHKVSL
ncbi:MAG: Fe-S cluster assembly protein SufD [Bacteroidota bacterium]|nr:Fe-S cluster assembly protein SufD [Bacteroidota bacterium]MDP4191146.1 Fe-S cluster assembly protein SufD [Bacteroidota bacterium]